MNHLRKFELETDYLQAKDSFVYPNVSYVVEKDILHYMKNSKYDFVDLGLPSGLQWAAWNVGAKKPEDSGLYFAWGEDKGYVVTPGEVIEASQGAYNAIITNADGSQTEKTFARNYSDYKYYDAATSAFTKYNETDGLQTLENKDDGCYLTEKEMRMPTLADFQELISGTTRLWTEKYNGSEVNGMMFTSKTNGNSIFVPAVGGVRDGVLNGLGFECDLWSSSVSPSSVGEVVIFDLFSSGSELVSVSRFFGVPLRAVRK